MTDGVSAVSSVDPCGLTGDELLRLVQDSDGTLRVDDPDRDRWSELGRAIWQVQERGLAPNGWRLTYTGRDQGDVVVRLVAKEESVPTAKISSPFLSRLG